MRAQPRLSPAGQRGCWWRVLSVSGGDDAGEGLTALFLVLLLTRIIAFFGMIVVLVFGVRALSRAATSRSDILTLSDAINFYGLVVVYVPLAMLVPMVGAAFLEPALYLAIALLLLLTVRLRIRAGGDSIDIGSVAIGLSRPDTRRATRLVLLATAAIVGATSAYGWFVLQGNVMGCFVRNCSTGLTLGVLGAITTAGILTAGVVCGVSTPALG